MSSRETSASDKTSVHFCVFIHGLWGNPGHLDHLSNALRKEYSEDDLHILVTKRNAGNWTYDGIEVGAERVTREIEDELEALEKDQRNVKKMSVIGYSLGGLLARYAIGLLYSKGLFERVEPVNFTTFATPHLGVRTPLLGWHSSLFNEIGARTLSASGHQLFLVDSFRDTEKPLLTVLADPSTIFMRALSAFKNRNLYANIINDRSVPYYTASISATDPFNKLDDVKINYDPDYEDVILDSENPVTPRKEQLTYYEAISNGAKNALSRAPYVLLFTAIIPIGLTFYFANSGYQAFSSARRRQLHQDGKGGLDASAYKIPLMLEDAQKRLEHTLEDIGAGQGQDHLPSDASSQAASALAANHDTSSGTTQNGHAKSSKTISNGSITAESLTSNDEKALVKSPADPNFPTLALAPDQFTMIDSLNRLGFKKYLVHIKRVQHTHAAIVVRMNRNAFAEGHVVSRHWLERFEI